MFVIQCGTKWKHRKHSHSCMVETTKKSHLQRRCRFEVLHSKYIPTNQTILKEQVQEHSKCIMVNEKKIKASVQVEAQTLTLLKSKEKEELELENIERNLLCKKS